LAQIARVVDVGSGPAVLPMHLLSTQAQTWAGVAWTCIDQANIPLSTVNALPSSIRLLGNCELTETPPPGGTLFGAAVSNFGLEYLASSRAAPALARWLAPGARLCAVMHAQGSLIDIASQRTLEDLDLAIDGCHIFEATAKVIDMVTTLPDDPVERMMHGVDERDAFNAAVNALKQRMEQRGAYSPVLLDILQTLRPLIGQARAGGLSMASKTLTETSAAYLAERERQHQMRQSALGERELASWKAELSRAGFTGLHAEPLNCNLGQIGWIVEATFDQAHAK
jgi:hypothetical protein